MNDVSIKVKFFGQCRELARTSDWSLRVPAQSTVQAALEVVSRCFTELSKLSPRLLVAVNEEYATPEQILNDGDILAIFPPVSGGQSEDIFELTHRPLDRRELVDRLLRGAAGAVVTFEGVVREHNQGRRVLYLEYEAYEEMAVKTLQQIGQEIHERWPIDRIGILHRLGRLNVGESSVIIAVTSAHRAAAFEACQYAINRLKKLVPLWKREYFENGGVWVEGEMTPPSEEPSGESSSTTSSD